MPIEDAIQWCFNYDQKQEAKQSIDLVVWLGIDPARSEHQVRSTLVPPGGSSKSHTICVVTSHDNAQIALDAGADFIADDETFKQIKAEEFNFTKLIATKEVISNMRQYARILGPKGLFPNAKSKTLINIEEMEDVISDL